MHRVHGLVSVVVPCWNRQKYIQGCLDGLVRQTYNNIEIIVVDDASTDGSASVVRRWRERLPGRWRHRVKLVRLPRNTGYAGALTIGMYLAKGEFIALQDSDDVSRPDRIQTEVDYLRRHSNIGLVGANYAVMSASGSVRREHTAKWLHYGFANIRRVYANGGHCVSVGTTLFRGRLFDKFGGITRRFKGAEDYELVAKLINNGIRVDNIRRVLMYYRSHPGQRSRRYYHK